MREGRVVVVGSATAITLPADDDVSGEPRSASLDDRDSVFSSTSGFICGCSDRGRSGVAMLWTIACLPSLATSTETGRAIGDCKVADCGRSGSWSSMSICDCRGGNSKLRLSKGSYKQF